jgi:hypothetical protein
MAKQKPQKRKQAYFIRRESHIDDSTFFSDQGRRVYFDKPEHARWLMANFKEGQQAKLVYGPVLEDDITYRELLETVWLIGTGPRSPGSRGSRTRGFGPRTKGVTADEYLAGVERTIDDARKGRDVSRRKARAFLKQMRVLAAHAQGR